MQFLKFMDDANQSKYPQVNAIRDPLSLKFKVPGTNKVRFFYELNIFLGYLLEAKPVLERHFLACHEYINYTPKQPWAFVLPKDALKIQDLDIPSIEAFDDKLKLKKNSTKTWFTTKTANMVMCIAKILPLPVFLEYDAFNEDIPAQNIYEQIQEIDEEDNPNLYYAVVKGFLWAVHTYQKVSVATVEIPAQLFQATATWEAKQYQNEMMINLFPGISYHTAPQIPTTPDRLVDNSIKTYPDAQNISPRLGTDPATAPAVDNLAKYGMCDMELERYMVMCGMKPGQESLMLKWVALLEIKGLSKEGNNITVQTVCK